MHRFKTENNLKPDDLERGDPVGSQLSGVGKCSQNFMMEEKHVRPGLPCSSP